jgi:sulfite reductase (NADPH) flavoprotein alpha-component
VPVFLRPNRHFRLPENGDTPIVMVGPGTGVAPFRAFLQHRREQGASGRNWLVFGDRSYTHDFLYQLDWQELEKDGVLTRLDVAFSRDQPEKVYVQHRLWEHRAELWRWLEEGASLYLCGDATAMAKDVHATLLKIAADRGEKEPAAWADGLVRAGRYLRDTY